MLSFVRPFPADQVYDTISFVSGAVLGSKDAKDSILYDEVTVCDVEVAPDPTYDEVTPAPIYDDVAPAPIYDEVVSTPLKAP